MPELLKIILESMNPRTRDDQENIETIERIMLAKISKFRRSSGGSVDQVVLGSLIEGIFEEKLNNHLLVVCL